MEAKQKKLQNIFTINLIVFCIILLFCSSLAIYYSYHDKKNNIVSSMQMIESYTIQEYESIISNFWQTYMPLISKKSDNFALLSTYFSSSENLSPLDKSLLSDTLDDMLLRDDRILWIAFYSDYRDINYMKYHTNTSLITLPSDFPYLDDIAMKQNKMEIYGRKELSGNSQNIDTFAICGGSPYGTGTIIVGYQVSSFSKAKDLLPVNLNTMQFYILSNEQLIYHSSGTYDHNQGTSVESTGSSLQSDIQTNQLYLCQPAGNNSSYVICSVDKVDFYNSAFSDLPLLLFIYLLFIIFSIFIVKYINKQTAEEVSIIKDGLNILSNNNLSYRLPTKFKQSGLDEIAQDINSMSSKLDETTKKAYYFELKQKDAQMAELQATFNPHFLYNTLEMLRNKSYSNGDADTAELIANLASIFRGFVGAKTFVTFREELAYSKKYLSLLIARYGDKVTFEYDIDSNLLNYGIIRNVFQLLIENYFVHGFDSKREDNKIRFVGKSLDETMILIQVQDNGTGMSPDEIEALNQKLKEPIRHSKENFGLKNLNQRLILFYGPEYGIHIEKNIEGGLTVFIRIKKLSIEEYEKMYSPIHN